MKRVIFAYINVFLSTKTFIWAVLQRCVVVQEVFAEGLVAQDGRLRPGDQIIEINGTDTTNASHHQV